MFLLHVSMLLIGVALLLCHCFLLIVVMLRDVSHVPSEQPVRLIGALNFKCSGRLVGKSCPNVTHNDLLVPSYDRTKKK